ncbi:MAG: hypothetical protein V4555_14015, partial [Acidobacteriota bacterium]
VGDGGDERDDKYEGVKDAAKSLHETPEAEACRDAKSLLECALEGKRRERCGSYGWMKMPALVMIKA